VLKKGLRGTRVKTKKVSKEHIKFLDFRGGSGRTVTWTPKKKKGSFGRVGLHDNEKRTGGEARNKKSPGYMKIDQVVV